MHAALEARGIQAEFESGPWGRRYIEFEQGDWETFQARHSHPEPFHRRVVRQSGGLIVNRWDITRDPLVPYVRPHKAVVLDGRKKPSKYLQPSRARYPGQSKRLDIHPIVLGRLAEKTEEPIYLCIEGSLKADAVAGTGRLAISVPSVTLWEAEEQHLRPWLPVLRRAPVIYVVPDSDYNPKVKGYGTGERPQFVNGGEVRFHTDRCVIHYRRKYGLTIRYLVPPYITRQQAILRGLEPKDHWKVGIDDHLAWGGNWRRWDRDENPLGLHEFEYVRGLYRRLPGKSRDSRTDKRDRTFIEHLEGTRSAVGLFSVLDVAAELGWSRSTAYEAKRSCVKRGVLHVWDGKPLGEGNGNKPHVYRFVIEDDL